MGLFNLLEQNSKKFPNKTALVIENKEYSYQYFYELVVQTIKNLKKNKFRANSVVIIIEDNTLSHILSIFSLSYLNATIVPTGRYYSNNHLTEIINITKANSVIGGKSYCKYFSKNPKIRNVICTEKTKEFSYFFNENKNKILLKNKLNERKDFIITLSSGSTAKPKPIIFSQETKIIRYKLFKKLYKIKSNDNVIVTSPIDHSLGMRTLLLPILGGGTCVVMNKFMVSKYCEYIKKYKVTFSVLVANQIYELLANPIHFKTFHLTKGLVSASAKLFPAAKNKIINKKINLYEMYGTAEIGTVTNINLLKNAKYLKSVGKSYHKKIKIKILSEKNQFLGCGKIGEIVCKTPGEFKMYLNSKKLNKAAYYKGYFKTGDIGYLNNKGYLFFLSRKKNIIRRSGISIYPEDIEKVFLKDAQINEVAVVGKETKLKTNIFLFIKKTKSINETYVKNICLKKLSKFQLPNKIIFLKKFPKSNLGKINKIKLLSLVH